MIQIFKYKWLQLTLFGLVVLFVGLAFGYWLGVRSVPIWADKPMDSYVVDGKERGELKSVEKDYIILKSTDLVAKMISSGCQGERNLKLNLAKNLTIYRRQNDEQLYYGSYYEQFKNMNSSTSSNNTGRVKIGNTETDREQTIKKIRERDSLMLDISQDRTARIFQLEKNIAALDDGDNSKSQLQDELYLLRYGYKLEKVSVSELKSGLTILAIIKDKQVTEIEIIR